MYERSDVSYVMFKGRWGRLSPEVRFGREQRLLGIYRGHDGAKTDCGVELERVWKQSDGHSSPFLGA